ncbi:inovirus Gp2 family protein [Pseudomonas sp. A-1]|uniref:inovirus Gp2 family protein n=1 Tax=Pseudomonas sp. A-1 TaxID=1821274 RepID=UPI0010A64B4F|nr:inovirus Gp2 family protein [Pseudomonas sp. A-1]THG82986.1 inovirus Gp2 family protein [Pseudomonas sp. A-1]
MPRHSDNKNLNIYNDKAFNGLPVQIDKGPFIREYLRRLYNTMWSALDQYPRVFAFRVDLRLPASGMLPSYAFTNEVISRFLESFKAKIKHNRRKARRGNPYAHGCEVRYAWCRELGAEGRPHYHLVILLNRDAFHTLGRFTSSRSNIFNRLEEAWASALRISMEAVVGLVHIPENPTYRLSRTDEEGHADFFYRASYLCKVATKAYGDRQHSFGASRT